jgi:hypothetical protein
MPPYGLAVSYCDRPMRSRAFLLLPLVLLAVMLLFGLVIEAVRFHTLLWATKLPLAVLLALAFLRRCTSSSRS